MKEPKFRIGDTVTPKTYLISGDIINCWRVRGGYRYTVLFDDYPAEDFNEKCLVLATYLPNNGIHATDL